MNKFLTPALLAATTLALLQSPVMAGHENPLYEAACQYREAAKHFEHEVDHSRYSSRIQRDLADDLEDASSDLRSASRRPERRHELISTWQQIQVLQHQVESVIFGNPNCPSRAELLPCWQEVLCAADRYRQQLVLLPGCHNLIGAPGHHGHHPTISPPLPVSPGIPTWHRYDPNWSRQNGSFNGNIPQHPYRQMDPRFNRSGWNQAVPSQVYRARPSASFGFEMGERGISRGQSFSPSQRQLDNATSHLQRQSSYRQLDAVTIGALISRLID